MSYFKLPLKPIDLLLILVGCVAVINATCENAHCPRFYNAECRDDHCESPPCEPHFFWRGKNVTLRCEAETCNTKTCADTRQCMEEVVTRPCPPGSSICRQYLNAKCVLMPIERQMSCSDITCKNGTVCRIRERLDRPYPVIVCIPTEKQTGCVNIHCEPGFSCVDEGNSITCVPILTTTEPPTVEPTSAETTIAQQTTAEPTTTETTEEPTIAETTTVEPTTAEDSCADITCTDGLVCTVLTVPSIPSLPPLTLCSINLTDIFEILLSCKDFESVCGEFPCIDSVQGGREISLFCSECEQRPFICPLDQPCTKLPTDLQTSLNITSACLPNSTLELGRNCTSRVEPCRGPAFYCAEAILENTVVASFCSEYLLYPTCEGVTCSSETICVEAQAGETQYTACLSPTLFGLEPTSAETTTVQQTTAEPTTAETTAVKPTSAETTTVQQTTVVPTTAETTSVEPTSAETTTAQQTTVVPTSAETTSVEPTTAEDSCADITCTDGLVCTVFTVPSIPSLPPLTQCSINLTDIFENILSCKNFGSVCGEFPCIDSVQGGREISLFCSECERRPFICPLDQPCTKLPTDLQTSLSITSACLPNSTIEFGRDCKSRVEPCRGPAFYCTEATLENNVVASFCSESLLYPTCEGVTCSSETICVEAQAGETQYTVCVSPTDFGLEPTSAETTTVQQTTAEPTIAEVTTAEPITTEQSTSTELPSTMGPVTPLRLAGPSCDVLNCPSSLPVCQSTQIPDLNSTIAVCVPQDTPTFLVNQVAQSINSTCEFLSCQDDEVCIEYFGDLVDSGTYCSQVNCSLSDNSSCPSDTTCAAAPISLLSAETSCIPDDVNFNFGINCTSDMAPICEPGLTCANTRKGEQMIGSYCTPIFSVVLTCNQIKCPEEYLCLQSTFDITPNLHFTQCQSPSVISSLLGCDNIQCEEGQQCVRNTETGIGECTTTMGPVTPLRFAGPSCDVLNCPSSLPVCQSTQIPDLNSTIAVCVPQDTPTFLVNQVAQSINSTCEFLSCQDDEVCIEYFGDLVDSGVYCSQVNCSLSDNSSCPSDTTCAAVPFSLLSAETSCIPDDVNFNFGINCTSDMAPICEPGLTCANTRKGEQMIGSYCTPIFSVVLTCNQIKCPEEYLCLQSTFDITPNLHFTQCQSLSVISSLLGCDNIQCEEGQQCVRNTETGIGECTSEDFTSRCANLRCTDGEVCNVLTVPSNPSATPFALCSFDLTDIFELLENFSCVNRGSFCGDFPCLDGVQGGRQVYRYCTGCEQNPSVCIPPNVCNKLPIDVATSLNVTSACLPNSTVEFGRDCKSREEPCLGPALYCTEATQGNTVVASLCLEFGIYPTCEGVTCDSENICAEVQAGELKYATCISPFLFGL